MSTPSSPSSRFFSRLLEHAERQPDATALTILEGDGQRFELSWEDLGRGIAQVAQEFRDQHSAGTTVALVSESIRRQIFGFLGAGLAGMRPTIFSHPSPKQTKEQFIRSFVPMLDAIDARSAWVDPKILGSATDWLSKTRITAHSLPLVHLEGERVLPTTPEGPFEFFQYSSGTTGARKGIRITERMLLQFADSSLRAIPAHEDGLLVSWLPLYHDMGLVGSLLVPLCAGAPTTQISPFFWIRNPASLLREMSGRRRCTTYMPNFAFHLLATRVPDDDLAGLDLSGVVQIINGAEPLKPAAFDKFFERYRHYGLRREALAGAYGVAENILTISVTPFGAGPPVADRVDRDAFRTQQQARPADGGETPALELVSSGRVIDDVTVRIAGASEDRIVGEIEIWSPWLFDGYVGRDRQECFCEDGYYKTGDLGYLAGEDLFVVGRINDMVIYRGENIDPADVERAAEAVPGVKAGRAVCFGVFDERIQSQQVVLLFETKGESPAEQLASEVRDHVQRSLSVPLHHVGVHPPGSLKKSTSGKLSRPGNRDLFLARRASEADTVEETALASSGGADTLLVRVTTSVRRVLGLGTTPHVEANVLHDLGADSLQLVEIAAELQACVGRRVPASLVVRGGTIAGIASLLASPDESPVLVTVRPGGDDIPVVILHGAFVELSAYARLAASLEGHPVHVFDVEAAVEGRSFGSLEQMATFYVRQLESLDVSRVALLGDCFGAFLAFEMARQLAESGRLRVERLVMLEAFSPMRATTRIFARTLQTLLAMSGGPPTLASVARRAASRLVPRFPYTAAKHRLGYLHMLDPLDLHRAELLPRLFPEETAALQPSAGDLHRGLVEHSEELGAAYELSSARSPQELARQAATLARHSLLVAGHRPRWKYPGDLHLITMEGHPERYHGWRRHTTGALRHHMYPFRATLRYDDPHEAFLEPSNIELFIGDLRAILSTGAAAARSRDSEAE